MREPALATAFLLCTLIFVYQTVKCFQLYFSQEVGSSLKYIFNGEDPKRPSFAFCNHPKGFFEDRHFVNDSITDYGLFMDDLMKVTGLANLTEKKLDYRNLIKNRLKNPLFGVDGIELFLDNGEVNFVRSEKFEWFYHPLYGQCAMMDINIHVNKSQSIKKMKISLQELYPCDVTGAEFGWDFTSCFGADFNNMFKMSAVITFIFQRGQFLLSQNPFVVPIGKTVRLLLSQTVKDESEVANFEASLCQVDADYDEDNCLFKCLARRFAQTTECLHPRIPRRFGHENVPDCQYEDMMKLQKNREFRKTLNQWEKNMLENYGIDPGLILIGQIINSFGNNAEQNRCKCIKPCRRKLLGYQNWKIMDSGYDFHPMTLEVIFDPLVFVFESYQTYTMTNLFGEVGGYLGLMLGFSVFSVTDSAELLTKMWEMIQSIC